MYRFWDYWRCEHDSAEVHLICHLQEDSHQDENWMKDETSGDQIPLDARTTLGHIKLDTGASKGNCSDILTHILRKNDLQ